jgi:4-amino-4-deoxy-L-arabinose transferase-like glycosyltransferase
MSASSRGPTGRLSTVARDARTLLAHPWLPPLLLTALAAVVFIWEIGDRSLWLDEATSVTLARRFAADFPAFSDYNMTLYYGLLYAWMSIGFGESETAVRLLSALAATAAVPVFYAVCRRLAGPNVAFFAAFLLIINSFVVYYAQETRGYALLLLLTVLLAWLVLHALDRPSWLRWAAVGLVGVMAFYTHYFAAFIIAAFGLYALLRMDEHVRRRLALPTVAVMAIATAPLGLAIVIRGACQIGYIDQLTVRGLTAALQEAAGDQGLGRPIDEAFRLGAALLAVYAVLIGIALFFGIRAIRARSPRSDAYLVPALALAVTGVGVVVISLLITPLLVPRYLIILAPWMALLAALGARDLRPRWQGALVGAVLVGLSVLGTVHLYGLPSREEWRQVAATVIEEAQPSDGIVFYSSSGEKPFDYYVRRASAVATAPIQISLPSDNLCQTDDRYDERLVAGLARVDPALHRRVWLVLTHEGEGSAQEAMVRARLARSYRLIERTLVGEKIEVLLYAAVASPTQAAPASGDGETTASP